MNRATVKWLAIAVSIAGLGITGLAAPAGALGTGTGGTGSSAPACKGAQIKPTVHSDALRREATLTSLVAKLQARHDPYGLNGPQISALQAANAAVTALDGQIAATCYPTVAALRADAGKLFVDYRVYWLRVPQTEVIDAADHLADARVRLGNAASKLAPLVGSNATAQADLAAMNAALAAADAKLGTPPVGGPTILPVASLQPAADMTHDTSVLEAAHADLLAARASLVEARRVGLKVITDLQH